METSDFGHFVLDILTANLSQFFKQFSYFSICNIFHYLFIILLCIHSIKNNNCHFPFSPFSGQMCIHLNSNWKANKKKMNSNVVTSIKRGKNLTVFCNKNWTALVCVAKKIGSTRLNFPQEKKTTQPWKKKRQILQILMWTPATRRRHQRLQHHHKITQRPGQNGQTHCSQPATAKNICKKKRCETILLLNKLGLGEKYP